MLCALTVYCVPLKISTNFDTACKTVLVWLSIKSMEEIGVTKLVGQSNDIFDLQFFFIIRSSNQPGPQTNGLKYFQIWFSFRRVKFFGVYYCAESVSPQYDTDLSQSFSSIRDSPTRFSTCFFIIRACLCH